MSFFPNRLLTSDDEGDSNKLYDIAIATIFAREVLEGAIIIGQYRTVIFKSQTMDEDFKKEALRTVTMSAVIASAFAVLVAVAVAVPLAILSNDLDETVVEIIEGISKVVAAICIVQLSVKLPVWLGVYKKVSLLPWKKYNPEKVKDLDDLSIKEIRFNVAWNIWREVAECGVFLIPFFLGSGAKAIPISAIIGVAISLVLGFLLHWANNRLENKGIIAFFCSAVTLFLSIGLFVGGCHEFEEVWGETKRVWKVRNDAFSHKEFPFVLLKPFGYSSSRTVLQITTFWCWLFLGLGLHYIKWHRSQNVIRMYGDSNVKRLESDDSSADSPVADLEAGAAAEEGEEVATEDRLVAVPVDENVEEATA